MWLFNDARCALTFIFFTTADPTKYDLDPQEALKSIIKVGLDFCKLKDYTGVDKPTVIT